MDPEFPLRCRKRGGGTPALQYWGADCEYGVLKEKARAHGLEVYDPDVSIDYPRRRRGSSLHVSGVEAGARLKPFFTIYS